MCDGLDVHQGTHITVSQTVRVQFIIYIDKLQTVWVRCVFLYRQILEPIRTYWNKVSARTIRARDDVIAHTRVRLMQGLKVCRAQREHI